MCKIFWFYKSKLLVNRHQLWKEGDTLRMLYFRIPILGICFNDLIGMEVQIFSFNAVHQEQ